MTTPVKVTFNVNVDVSGNIDVTQSTEYAAVNPLYPSTLNVSDLCGNTISLFQFQEPGTINDISGQVTPSATTDLTPLTFNLVKDLQALLEGSIRCDEAVPFSSSKYSLVDEYKHSLGAEAVGFGRVALETYAHYLFGHVQATAAIDNDVEFMHAMLSQDASGQWEYKGLPATTFLDGSGVPLTAALVTSPTNAKLALRLVDAILKADATAIAKAVIGQDATRAMDHDNNLYSPDAWQNLQFIAGDSIVLKITLNKPSVSFTAATGNQAVTAASLENAFDTVSPVNSNASNKIGFDVVITLA